MAAITKNVFSNQFSISFPIMSCYLLKNDQKYSTPILVNCSVSLLDICYAADLIVSTVFYLLKQVAPSFVGTSCRMITTHEYNCVGGITPQPLRPHLITDDGLE